MRANLVGSSPRRRRPAACTGKKRGKRRESRIRITGQTAGLKANQIQRIERLGRRRLPSERLVTHEFARQLSELSRETGRQIGVLVDRRGDVSHVMVGDAHSITLPDWGRMRAGPGRLRGLRCIHTHLGDQPLNRDDLTDLALLRLDAMVAVAVDEAGLPGLAYAATLAPQGRGDHGVEHFEPKPPARFDLDFRAYLDDLEEELARQDRTRDVSGGERAILVSVTTGGRRPPDTDAQVAELAELARSAGLAVADMIRQHRPQPDSKFLIGSGRLQDLVIQAFQTGVDLVIFDQNLTPVQARNLTEHLDLRVIDRTQLILDIFAQRASTRDGKLQVELAQQRYRLPRLAQQQDRSLSRLGAGVGGRGPGETKLESDRRRVRDRITRLEKELEKLRGQRAERRRRRGRRDVPILSIVGYTNAGKSTLLRALTHADVEIEDKLFATLDPTSRRLRFPREREVIVTDTVGFIRDLPKDLVAAFQATLEEMRDADLLLHVVDASAPDLERRMSSVRQVLNEIGLSETPELLVFNQSDKLPPGEAEVLASHRGGVAVSALGRTGLGELLRAAESILFRDLVAGSAERGNGMPCGAAFAAQGH